MAAIVYGHDVEVIVDALDQIKYTLLRAGEDAAVDVHGDLTPTLALLRGRLSALPDNVIPVVAGQDLANPGRSTALIQRFLGRPAIVAAIATGSDSRIWRPATTMPRSSFRSSISTTRCCRSWRTAGN